MNHARREHLREAHCHLPSLGRSLSMLRLDQCRSVEECLDLLRQAAATVPDTRPAWLLACGARVESWAEPRWPTRRELDTAARGRPLALLSFDHHAVAANSAAIAESGLAAPNASVPGGIILKDDAGQATGLFLEAAAWRVWNAAPAPTESERRAHLRDAVKHLSALGYIEAHDLLSPSWLGPELAGLHDAGDLPLPIGLFPPYEDFEQVLATSGTWSRPAVRLLGAKMFADGTLNSRTAGMLTDYADPHPGLPRGKQLLTTAQIAAALERVNATGLTLAVHAIGDAAVRSCLDAAEQVLKRDSGPAPLHFVSSSRSLPAAAVHSATSSLRIEHCELIDESDVPRFARLGVTASVQPCHLLADVEALGRGVPHRLHRVLPLRDLIDSGLVPGRSLIFGSDAPIVRADPVDSIRAAVHRRREGAPGDAAIAGDQVIREEEAWRCFGAGS